GWSTGSGSTGTVWDGGSTGAAWDGSTGTTTGTGTGTTGTGTGTTGTGTGSTGTTGSTGPGPESQELDQCCALLPDPDTASLCAEVVEQASEDFCSTILDQLAQNGTTCE